ncbi:MAG: ABC transporter permease, partial [Rhodothermales bacterium]|nr:ABC transporter permease [Rhodothermales bacterium]
MLASSYIRTALRGMRRHWSYTLINVFGLAMGFVASFFIVLWVQDELAFNQHYEEGDRVFRVMRTATFGPDQVFTWPAVTYMLDDVLDEEYPEIEMAAAFSWGESLALRRGQTVFRETGIHAGPDYFRILQHPFLAGNPETALAAPDAIVLSAKLARKYFPEAFQEGTDRTGAVRVLGESINKENRADMTVTGVYEDPVATATYRPDFVVTLDDFLATNDWLMDWGNNGLR